MDAKIASDINSRITEICRQLDESAAMVRRSSASDGAIYAISIAEVFETINARILEPLYQEHPDLAPSTWNDS
jgi:hypothetical protein